MKKVAFIVDSSSSIKDGEYDNVYVCPIGILENNNGKIVSYKDQIDIDNDKLCQLLNGGADLSTSQPAAGDFVKIIESIQDKYDEIYAMPISPKLSSTINTWTMITEDYPKVKAIPLYTLSSLTRQYIEYFIKLSKKKDLSAQIISDYIEKNKNKWAGFLIVPNVDQLKKGGRVSAFKSVFVKMLNLKLIISYDHNGLIFLDKSSKIDGCIDIIKNAFNNKINLDKKKVKSIYLFESNLNKKYDVPAIVSALRKEFNLPESKVKTTHFPSGIVCHTGVDYAAIIAEVE